MPSLGQRYVQTETIDDSKIGQFIALTGDVAPAHVDAAAARDMGYEGRIAHGLLLSSYFSAILGMRLPGENYVIHSLNFGFRQPVYIGDTVELSATVVGFIESMGAVQMQLSVQRNGAEVMTGTARCIRRAAGKEE